MLLHRVLSAVVGIPLGLYVVWRGGIWFAALVVLLALIGFQELHATLRTRQIEVIREIGFPATIGLVLGAHYLAGEEFLLLVQGALLLSVAGSLAFQVFVRVQGSRLASASSTVLGVVYVGFLFSFFVLLREIPGPGAPGALPFGLRVFLVVWFATWGADTGAYAAGKTLGKHKLCPAISPGKTVEGAIGGLLGALLFASWIGCYWLRFRPEHVLPLGALAAGLGLIGDLSKSVIKREIGVKDFGALIPGHGGVLDRFDSLLFNVPVAYFFAIALMR